MDSYTANIHIREFPLDANTIITLLANKRGCPKWEVVRDALVEYVENHKHEMVPIL